MLCFLGCIVKDQRKPNRLRVLLLGNLSIKLKVLSIGAICVALCFGHLMMYDFFLCHFEGLGNLSQLKLFPKCLLKFCPKSSGLSCSVS